MVIPRRRRSRARKLQLVALACLGATSGAIAFARLQQDASAGSAGSISGSVVEDVDGNGDLGDAVGRPGVAVWVYADEGNGVPDAGDAFVAATATDASGAFALPVEETGTYWLAVDSAGVTPSAGYTTGAGPDDVWADQTYGPAGAARHDGAGWSFAPAAGPLPGGKDAGSDRFGTLSGAQHVTRVEVGSADVSGLVHAFSFVAVTSTLDEDAADDFDSPASWASFDADAHGVGTEPVGFEDGVFDGRFLYLAPDRNNSTGIHGEVLRYDTTAAFDDPAAWAGFDASANGVGTNPKGYSGGAYDGRYVYLAPEFYGGSTDHGEVLRYDTTGSFTDPSAWSTYDPSAHGVGTDPKRFNGAAFDGRYLIMVPGATGHHEALRYDTTAPFDQPGSWEAFDLPGGGVGDTGDSWAGNGILDGHHVLWGAASGSEILRYDVDADFTDPASWAIYDPAADGVGTDSPGYRGGGFDGRFVFFAPQSGGSGMHGEVLRYDSTGPFADSDSWSVFDPGANGVGVDPDGYEGVSFDGRHVYFAPFDNGTSRHGEVLRYDTRSPFTDAASWEAYDAGENGVGVDPDGFDGTLTDGRYVYFVPDNNGMANSGEVLRYDTARTGQGTLRRFIANANAIAGAQRSVFALRGDDPGHAGGVWTIAPVAALPAMAGPGAVDARAMVAGAGRPAVELDGRGLTGPVDGLSVTGDEVTVAGLAIGGFAGPGIRITGARATVAGNHIGTDAAGTTDRANTGHGVLVASGRATIGGLGDADGNLIRANGGDGVAVTGTGLAAVAANSVTANGGLGIDLADDGVTLNDPGDADSGPNDRLNRPVLASVVVDGGASVASGTLDVPAGTYRLELFTSVADSSEGADFRGFALVTSVGIPVPFEASFTSAPGTVTATATACTDASCTALRATSEFSGPVTVDGSPTLAPLADREDRVGDTVTLSVTATDPDGDALGFAAAGLPPGATIDAATGEIVASLTGADLGARDVTVIATDPKGASAATAFRWTVVDESPPPTTSVPPPPTTPPPPPPDPGPPVLEPRPDRSLDEGDLLVVPLAVVDGRAVSYAVTAGPAAVVIEGDTLSWATGEDDGPSTVTVEVTATDDEGRTGSAAFGVTVAEVNQAPSVLPVDQLVLTGGTLLRVDLRAEDPDRPAGRLHWQVADAPAGVTVDGDGVLRWPTPSVSASTTHSLVVRVVDEGTPALHADAALTVVLLPPIDGGGGESGGGSGGDGGAGGGGDGGGAPGGSGSDVVEELIGEGVVLLGDPAPVEPAPAPDGFGSPAVVDLLRVSYAALIGLEVPSLQLALAMAWYLTLATGLGLFDRRRRLVEVVGVPAGEQLVVLGDDGPVFHLRADASGLWAHGRKWRDGRWYRVVETPAGNGLVPVANLRRVDR